MEEFEKEYVLLVNKNMINIVRFLLLPVSPKLFLSSEILRTSILFINNSLFN